MRGYSVKVDGKVYQWANATLEQAADQVASAHRAGAKWDVRRRTGAGGELRVLTEAEAAQLVAAVTLRFGREPARVPTMAAPTPDGGKASVHSGNDGRGATPTRKEA